MKDDFLVNFDCESIKKKDMKNTKKETVFAKLPYSSKQLDEILSKLINESYQSLLEFKTKLIREAVELEATAERIEREIINEEDPGESQTNLFRNTMRLYLEGTLTATELNDTAQIFVKSLAK